MDERLPNDPRLTRVHLRRELIVNGWSDRALARQVAAGSLAKPRRGAYVDGADWQALDGPGRHEVRTRAVLRQAETDVVASHASAVPLLGGPTWGLNLSDVHITRVDGKTGRAESGVRQHVGRLVDGDVVSRHGVAVTSPARNALEVTTVASTEAALAVTNDYLHRKLTTPEQLRLRFDDGFDHWPHSLGSDLVIRLASPLIESVGETRFFYFCFVHGIPAPQLQYEVHDETGALIANLDFAWPDLGAFVEFDGKVKYQKLLRPGENPGDVVFREKRREDKVREITGFRCLRTVWADFDQPHYTATRVRRLLDPPARRAG